MEIKISLLIILPIIWIAFSILEGIREGYTYAYRDSKDDGYKKDLHPLFTIQRGLMVIALLIPLICIAKYYVLLEALAFALVFPLIHDGMYYVTRHRINNDVYKDGFLTDKNTSTAKISFQRFFHRLGLAMLACVAYGLFVWMVTK